MYEILVSVNILVEMDIVTCTGRRLEQPLAGNERHTSFLLLLFIIIDYKETVFDYSSIPAR